MRYKIYSKDGSVVRCATEKLEYNGTFMGESSVTISVKSNKSIDFQIGDYVLYRGEKFTFENIPTEKKTDHPNANGSVFQYDNIKLNGYDSDLQIPFDDFVGTSDTDHSFTAQPDFSFVAATIDDLAQRVQANLDRYYTGDKKWTIVVADGATDEDKKNMLITVSNISCWDAICYCKSKYGKNFIRRGRTITLGANGSTKDITFKVGSHKGLYDMTRNVQADQRIVTRLKSYGNTTNMPVRYYNQLTACGKFTVGTIQSTSSQISLTTEFPHSYPETDRLYITNVDSFNASGVIKITLGGVVFDVSVNPNDQRNTIRMAQYIASQSYPGWSTKCVSGTNYVDFVCLTLGKKGVFTFNSNGTQVLADIKVDIEGTDKMYLSGYTAVNNVAKYAVTLMCGGIYVSAIISQGISTYNDTTADIMLAGNESSFTAFKAALTVGGTVYISTGANIGYLEEQYTSYISYDVFSDLPNNMNIANLMLPGFPKQTLAEWVEANKSKYTWLQDYISQGYTFSTEKYYPYINSKNITSLGIRPYSQYFTSEDDTHKDIYPSLQYFSDGRNKAVGCTDVDGNAITDSGILKNGDNIEFKIIIKDLGFNFADVQVGSTSPVIHFNTGYCGGRDFTAKSWTKNATTGYWEMRCERVYDSSIGRYFPYKDANILSGDKFVITDIKMPTEYIEQASVELLYWSFKWLVLNDFSIYSYSLSPDTNFIKRHDDAITDKTTTFHQTVREGDLLQIDDTDIAVTGAITVDTIKITEGDGLLPKYEITLRDTKTVGTIEKIQQQIDSLSGNVSSVASVVSSPSGNGLNTDIVKELDTTTLTDANVFSSLRVLKEISDRGHTHTNKAVLDNLTQAVIDNSHTHTNKAILDVIDQSLSTASAVNFSKVTANDAELGTIKATTGDFSGAVKAAAATVIGLITCATLNADAATIPTIAATNINVSTQVVSPLFVGRLQGNADTATRLKDTFKLWGQDFYGNNVSGAISGATTIDASGAVTLGSTLSVASDATFGGNIGTSSYISQSQGWRVTNAGNADFRSIYTDELHATAFTADVSQALTGSDYLTKSVSKLSQNFIIPSVGSSVRIIVDDLEGLPATQCFENSDYVRFRAFNRTSGLTISDVWGTVQIDTTFGTNGFSNGTQAYTYTVTSAAVTGISVYKGSEVLDYGKSSDGLIVRTTLYKNNSPYSQIATWVNDPSNPSNYTVHARLGNLAGISHCSGYGLYTDNAFLTNQLVVGDLTKTKNYLSYNPSEGLIIKGNLYVSSGAVASAIDVNTAKSQAIDAASSDATNKANSALTSAKSYADSGDSNTLSSAKSYTDTQFSVADGKITAAITTTNTYADNAATTAVDNLQIGGRNYLLNSVNNNKSANITFIENGVEIDFTNQRDTYFGIDTASDITLLPTPLTLSFFVSGLSDSDNVSFYFNWAQSFIYTIKNGVNSISNFNVNNNNILFFDDYNRVSSSKVQITKFKLEKGNKPTDWTPAPEDVDASIATKVATTTYDAKMTLIDSAIISKVSQTDFNALGQRVSSAETSISQNSRNIELKVAKDGVISAINQTSESVTIDASKINLQGAVTISSMSSDAINSLNATAKGYANTAQNNAVSTAAIDATNKIKAIQTGGRNLLRENEYFTVYNNYGTTCSLHITGDKYYNMNIWELSMTPTDGVIDNFRTAFSNHGVYTAPKLFYAANKYVVSVFWKPISNQDIEVGLEASNIYGWTDIETVSVGDGWKRSSAIHVDSVDRSDQMYFSFRCPSATSGTPIVIQWTCPMLEISTSASSFSPAPEDVDSAIATSQTNSQNNLAVKIGYASYDDMVAKATAGNTIINGAYIRTTLIESVAVLTNGLVAHKINADDIDTTSITSSAAFVNSLTANTAFISNLKTNIVNAAYVNTLGITSLGAVTAGSFNIGSGNFAVSSAGLLSCVGATISGEVTATSGKIGGFKITNSTSLLAETPMPSGVGVLYSMLLSQNLIKFTGPYAEVKIGADALPASAGGNIIASESTIVNRSISGGSYGNIAKYISVEGATSFDDTSSQMLGNHALYIAKGDICGFRLRTRRVNTSQTLSVMDSIIKVNNYSTDITITLPYHPEDGQTYLISRTSDSKYFFIAGNGATMWGDWGSQTDTYYVKNCRMMIATYDKVNNSWNLGITGW